MRLINSTGLALFVLLCSVSSFATADVVVYLEKNRYDSFLHGGKTYRASYSHKFTSTLAGTGSKSPDKNSGQKTDQRVIVIDRVATWWVKPAYGNGRIRITVPLQLYLASWDVKALEKELERLGVKIRSKPVKPVPKPGPVISG